MSWQYILLTFLAAFPALMWVVGQIMDQRLSRKSVSTEKEEPYEQTMKEQMLCLISGVAQLMSMLGFGIGVFGHKAFLIAGIVSFILNLLLFKRLGVFKTILKG